MKIDVSLDVNLLAVQQDEELTALVELTAPSAKAEEQRAPCALVVVLDRSGSMAGDRLDGREAGIDLPGDAVAAGRRLRSRRLRHRGRPDRAGESAR